MNYRSIADLSESIRRNLHKIPSDIDLIVGIPRSGMLAANILALDLNLKLCDTMGFCSNTPLANGRTRHTRTPNLLTPSDASHILLVDDSVETGESMNSVRKMLSAAAGSKRITTCAIYASPHGAGKVNVYLEVVKQPRAFEWNMMHRSLLSECCVDIDGVLCLDPQPADNDDGEAYRRFLAAAQPLCRPTYHIGHLVTSRLEKYRSDTEAWLRQHQITYSRLHMLDLPDAATRRRLGCHASFKADVYSAQKDACLFIESEETQARDIANASGKPVLCFGNQQLYRPEFSYARLTNDGQRIHRRVMSRASHLLKKALLRV